MAKLTIFNEQEERTMICFDNGVGPHLRKHGIDLTRCTEIDFSSLQEYCNEFGYKGFDVYNQRTPYLHMKFHYHDQKESRIVISGKVRFKLKIDKEIYRLDLVEGDWITLPPGIVHDFYSEEPFESVRFFGTEQYQTIFV